MMMMSDIHLDKSTRDRFSCIVHVHMSDGVTSDSGLVVNEPHTATYDDVGLHFIFLSFTRSSACEM